MNVPHEDTTPCKDCRAPIVFARTNRVVKGKPGLMPVDRDPDPAGNVILTRAGNGKYYAGVLNRNQADGARDDGTELHMSHVASCLKRSTSRRP